MSKRKPPKNRIAQFTSTALRTRPMKYVLRSRAEEENLRGLCRRMQLKGLLEEPYPADAFKCIAYIILKDPAIITDRMILEAKNRLIGEDEGDGSLSGTNLE